MADRRVGSRMMTPATDSPTFEKALLDLERVVHDLEDGQLSLEEALARYEAGVGLLKLCYGRLQTAEQRILRLTGVDAEGQPVLDLFGHCATAELAPAQRKR
jgi:exodeoxyribonuclease VII small subunit